MAWCRLYANIPMMARDYGFDKNQAKAQAPGVLFTGRAYTGK